jgi:hypothetical protein
MEVVFIYLRNWLELSVFLFFMICAFGESLSFAAQKKVTPSSAALVGAGEKGTLPLLLSRHGGTRRPAHNGLYNI